MSKRERLYALTVGTLLTIIFFVALTAFGAAVMGTGF